MEPTKASHGVPVPRFVILLKAARGFYLVDVRTILYAQADARYSRITFTDGSAKPVFHTLAELETILRCGERMGDLVFVRVHKSHMIAFHHAISVGTDRRILLSGEHCLPIGRQYWSALVVLGMSIWPGMVVQDGQVTFDQHLGSR